MLKKAATLRSQFTFLRARATSAHRRVSSHVRFLRQRRAISQLTTRWATATEAAAMPRTAITRSRLRFRTVWAITWTTACSALRSSPVRAVRASTRIRTSPHRSRPTRRFSTNSARTPTITTSTCRRSIRTRALLSTTRRPGSANLRRPTRPRIDRATVVSSPRVAWSYLRILLPARFSPFILFYFISFFYHFLFLLFCFLLLFIALFFTLHFTLFSNSIFINSK